MGGKRKDKDGDITSNVEEDEEVGQDGGAGSPQKLKKRKADEKVVKSFLPRTDLDPVLCGVFAQPFTSALDCHQRIYRGTSTLTKIVQEALKEGDQRKADHYLAVMAAMSGICVKSAEILGMHAGYGLNAMLRYVNSRLLDCLSDPGTAVYEEAAANAALEFARKENAHRFDRPPDNRRRDDHDERRRR